MKNSLANFSSKKNSDILKGLPVISMALPHLVDHGGPKAHRLFRDGMGSKGSTRGNNPAQCRAKAKDRAWPSSKNTSVNLRRVSPLPAVNCATGKIINGFVGGKKTFGTIVSKVKAKIHEFEQAR